MVQRARGGRLIGPPPLSKASLCGYIRQLLALFLFLLGCTLFLQRFCRFFLFAFLLIHAFAHGGLSHFGLMMLIGVRARQNRRRVTLTSVVIYAPKGVSPSSPSTLATSLCNWTG
jgi:hypothetical protein